ncbi:MAG: biotin--[acetyl-CoA-carboxylase] ligase [Synergistaceae bacterium]|nr:biotin--[acetyl-CoA-carboxylase] ligase [Synergistaceae bacterium]
MKKSDPIAAAIGRVLSGAKEGRRSLRSLSEALSISDQDVCEGLETLSEQGFDIRKTPEGIELHSPPEYDLAPSYVASLLPEDVFGDAIIHTYDTLPSTQDTAKELGRNGNRLVVVFAEEQTKGKGRRGRRWLSCRGCGLFFSVLFKPPLPACKLQLVNLAAALAVKDAVSALYSVELSVKWPNDLLYKGGKVCGILSEASIGARDILDCRTGIGINIVPPDPVADEGAVLFNANHIGEAANAPVHRGRLAAEILARYFRLLDQAASDGGQTLLYSYRASCSTLGRDVSVITDEGTVTGKAVGIGEDGELLLETEGGEMAFNAVDVVHATPS